MTPQSKSSNDKYQRRVPNFLGFCLKSTNSVLRSFTTKMDRKTYETKLRDQRLRTEYEFKRARRICPTGFETGHVERK